MRAVRRDQSEAANQRTATCAAMEFHLSGLRRHTHAASHERRQAAVSFVGLRDQQTGSGTILPDRGPGLRYPDGCATLLQRLWHATSALKSLHRRLRDLFRTFAE